VDGSEADPTDTIQTLPNGPTGFPPLVSIPTRPSFSVLQPPLLDNTSTVLANPSTKTPGNSQKENIITLPPVLNLGGGGWMEFLSRDAYYYRNNMEIRIGYILYWN
jgi:hypothetical protein